MALWQVNTINVFNRQSTTIFTQLEAKIINQAAWNGLMFSSAIIIWLHFRRPFYSHSRLIEMFVHIY